MEKKPTFATFAADKKLLEKMLSFYDPFKATSPSPYILLFAKDEGFAVSIYRPNKNGLAKVVFQGPKAITEASIWNPNITPSVTKLHQISHPLPRFKTRNYYPQIGSDEVGTGDFFGPICVCAAYVEAKDLVSLNSLGITDSKAMEDAYILSIGPKLIHTFAYSELSLPNERYNEIHSEMNMNAIKAMMHNRCDLNLLAKYPQATLYQDQFAEPSLYYSYLQKEPQIAKGIIFHTKGESLFPSVALASVIARYSFLRKMDALSAQYGLAFPFGAGPKVDDFAVTFVSRFGKDELKRVAKLNFANAKKLIKTF